VEKNIAVTQRRRNRRKQTRRKQLQPVQVAAPLPQTQAQLHQRQRSISFFDMRNAVAWLNATVGSASHRRVLKIRDELEELSKLFDSLQKQQQELNYDPSKTSEEIFADQNLAMEFLEQREQFRKRHNAFNERLAKYRFVPALAYDLATGIWRFATIPKSKQGPEVKIPQESGDLVINEVDVIAALARLAANRELHKVRQCEYCHEAWRVSEREMDRFCSKKCRAAFEKAKPGFLERKRKNQKNWREKAKAEAAKELANVREGLPPRKGKS
jgi:hypothetical protein